MDTSKELIKQYALSFIGTWYSWAGNSPEGFDCSGYVVEVLKAAGLLNRRCDKSAHGLYEYFIENVVKTPHFGCLALYWNRKGTKIIHVEMFLDSVLTIGASGGGSKTKTKEDAIRDNAFIKIRPLNKTRGAITIVDPFKKVHNG